MVERMFQERLAAGSAYHGFIAMTPSIPSAILGTVRPLSYEHLYELALKVNVLPWRRQSRAFL